MSSPALTDTHAHDDPNLIGARKAASVIVLRDSPQGPEVLMLRRAERDGDIRSGVWVFPGGVLDPVDRQLHARCVGDEDAQASARLALPQGGLDYSVAAVRECFEEAGLLLDHPGLGRCSINGQRMAQRQGLKRVAGAALPPSISAYAASSTCSILFMMRRCC